MSDKFTQLNNKHIEFIDRQQMFFVGTAASTGFVNVSPKGMDSFKIIDQTKVVWLNYTGSGNESAAHLLDSNRMTVMFCSFEKQPLILRLYGRVNTIHPRDEAWDKYQQLFDARVGARQFFELELDLVQTSCGYSIPYYDYKGPRDTLKNWSEKTGEEGVQDYWRKKNQLSLDGFETGILSD